MSVETKRIKPLLQNIFSRPLFNALLLSLLVLPFTGPKTAVLLLFASLLLLLSAKLSRKLSSGFTHIKGISSLISLISRYRSQMLFLLALLLCITPVLHNSPYTVDVLTLCLIYSILALGLNVIVGMTGLLHLGFAAFYAIGAYTYALFSINVGISFWLAATLSAIIAALSGFILAFPALRLKGDYLAIVTLGFGEILRIILNNWKEVTNGPNGISKIPPPSIFGYSLDNLGHFFYLSLAVAILVFVVIGRVEQSAIGRAWVAIREDEIAASSLGIDVTRYKLMSFAFGSFWAGLAGALFASKMGFISPESFTFLESALILCMVILGGLGSRYGAVAGAFILIGIPELLRDVQTYRMLFLGITLIILMLFMPGGIGGKRAVSVYIKG